MQSELNTAENRMSCMAPPFMASAGQHAPAGMRDDHSPSAGQAVLIREAQRGRAAAFEQLLRSYDKPLLRLAIQLTGSEHDAQDVCQEAFLCAYRKLASFRHECSFYTWIYRIVINRCLDYLRRRQNLHETSSATVSLDSERTDLVDRLPDTRYTNNPENNLAARELRARISRALQQLSPRERIVFELKHYEDLKLRAVALMLKTSEGNARHALFRATRKLRCALAEVR